MVGHPPRPVMGSPVSKAGPAGHMREVFSGAMQPERDGEGKRCRWVKVVVYSWVEETHRSVDT